MAPPREIDMKFENELQREANGNAWCICDLINYTNTKSLAKEFSKILIFEYFGYLKIGFDVFFDADSESPRMT